VTQAQPDVMAVSSTWPKRPLIVQVGVVSPLSFPLPPAVFKHLLYIFGIVGNCFQFSKNHTTAAPVTSLRSSHRKNK